MYLVGAILIIIAVAAIWMYYSRSRQHGEIPKAERQDETRPAEGRDHTWDPKDRYGDGEPPAAR